jgi:2-haloacid dehalogenase
MTTTLAFDVYGTLIDPLDVSKTLAAHVGEQAPRFAQIWRDKQLEYLFRRALMREYRDFATCTRQALAFADQLLQTGLSADTCEELMATYRRLPAYADAVPALEQLKAGNHRMYAFSNGHPDDLEQLLAHAGLDEYLDGIVSVHAVASFKPDPVVYQHFLDNTGSTAADTWLVSGNPFDIIGAHAAGWATAWIKRDAAAVFDPWGVNPTATVTGLGELSSVL